MKTLLAIVIVFTSFIWLWFTAQLPIIDFSSIEIPVDVTVIELPEQWEIAFDTEGNSVTEESDPVVYTQSRPLRPKHVSSISSSDLIIIESFSISYVY